MASAVYESLVRHAKISQSQSLSKQFDWLTRQQLSIANWTLAKLSLLRALLSTSKFALQLNPFNQGRKGGKDC